MTTKNMSMGKNALALAGCATLLLSALVSGCTPEARQDVGQAGDNLGQAAQKSAQGTAEAVDKAGDKVAEGTKAAVQETQQAAVKTGQAIEKGAQKTGQAIEKGTTEAGQAIEKGAAKVGDAAQDVGATASLTPKVRNAIIADDKVKILDLNVDTKADTKEVIVMGTASSDAEHKAVIADAKKALADAKSDYKLVDKVTMGAAKK